MLDALTLPFRAYRRFLRRHEKERRYSIMRGQCIMCGDRAEEGEETCARCHADSVSW